MCVRDYTAIQHSFNCIYEEPNMEIQINTVLCMYVHMHLRMYYVVQFMYVPAASVVCDPTCDHGVCISTNSCNCAAGYSGPTCSVPGEFMHQTVCTVYLCITMDNHVMYYSYEMYTHYVSKNESLCVQL